MIRQQYQRIRERAAEAALRAGRDPKDVRLMAVTKTVDVPRILEAIEAGANLLGENRVQELALKRPRLPCETHLIGHLQSNKVSKAVVCADMIQSVDSVRLAGEISKECRKQGKAMPVLLEVNIGRDASKFGFPPEEVWEALEEIARFPGIKVSGLMTIPPICENLARTRNFFSQMHALWLDICTKKMDNIVMDILSMGMSGDFEAAIAEGSTLVRVGSAVFGARN